MKQSWKIKGNHIIVHHRWGNVHLLDYEKPSRLMWITARSQRHADRLIKLLRWHSQWRTDFVRETYYDSKHKVLMSGVWASR